MKLSERLAEIINEQDFCFEPDEMRDVEEAIRQLAIYERAEADELIEAKKENRLIILQKMPDSDKENEYRVLCKSGFAPGDERFLFTVFANSEQSAVDYIRHLHPNLVVLVVAAVSGNWK